MHIGLHDAEVDHMKNKSFPNYALMKISAWHKRQGDTVEWWDKDKNYDRVYSSKVFDYTPENPYLPADTIKGGTGYDVRVKLPLEIDDVFPDYSIYPTCDYAIGYITRGCPNLCSWCVVPEKEGGIQPYRHWRELVRPDSDRLVLMDNNILSCEYGIAELEALIGSGYRIDLNQGMDARLVDERIADILARLKWIRFIRFSCDRTEQIDAMMKAAELLGRYGVKPYRLFVYLLVTKDIENAATRVDRLKQLKNISLFAQPERNEAKGVIPNRVQKEFAHRHVGGRCFRKESWREYRERKKLIFEEQED